VDRLKDKIWIQQILLHLPWIVMGILLCWPAFYNGFPLVYSDSGTYINNSFDLSPPPDRAVGYGYFIRLVTWQASLWPVVLAQGLLLSGGIWRAMRLLLGEGRPWIFSGMMVVLASCTSLPWFVSQLMPDIFAGVLILGMGLLAGLGRNRGDIALGLLMVFLACIVHTSHIFVGLAVWLCLAMSWLHREPLVRMLQKSARLALPIACAGLFTMANQAANGHGFRLSRSSNVFMTARLAEAGLLEPFLNENCHAMDYAMCRRAYISPMSADQILWNAGTSVIGRFGSWERADSVLAPMVKDYFGRFFWANVFVKAGIRDGIAQLQRFGLGDGISPQHWDDAPCIAIRWRMPRHTHAFLRTRQHADTLHIHSLQDLQKPLVWGSAALLLLLALLYWRRWGVMRNWSVVLVLGLLANAFVLATLASPVDRYQARISWLLPWLAMLALAALFVRPKQDGTR
jgi:hypothetical protein